MKPYLLFVIIALNSCNKATDFTERHYFKLIDKSDLEIGTMECELPADFDTTYSWFNDCGDCFCGGVMTHRSHNKRFKVLKESGAWYSEERLDSGFYFTISYLPNIKCDTQSLPLYTGESEAEIKKQNRESEIQNLYKGKMNGLSVQDVFIDTNRVINSHTFDIYIYQESFVANPFIFLSARTEYNDRYIGLSIQSNVQTRDTFIRMAKDILSSIKIE